LENTGQIRQVVFAYTDRDGVDIATEQMLSGQASSAPKSARTQLPRALLKLTLPNGINCRTVTP
jgi:hypothetical protein